MQPICLTLPTNRACAPTIAAVHAEAAYAAQHFGVQVHLLILDSAEAPDFAEHTRALRELPAAPGVSVHHLDEAAQRDVLQQVIQRAALPKPDLVLELMLPAGLSYGACTNRAFLLAGALGCGSVHRRDSDSRYQLLHGAPVFPIQHELASLGRRAVDAADGVTRSELDLRHGHKTVAMVGSSFVGELSVDIGEVQRLDPDVYFDIVSLWAPGDWTPQQKQDLVDESFRGAGNEPFTGDETILGLVDPMRVDMCNISFHGVHEDVPLPPATDTIGSDYFLIHLVQKATLPGVLHNRNIVNFYTGERRTGPGFTAYQLRLVKFFLSMLYLNAVYADMAEAGASLLDARHRVRADAIAASVRASTWLDRGENVHRLESLARSYRTLGGRYAECADLVAARSGRLLDEARQDMEDFAVLIEAWAPMVAASKAMSFQQLPR
ncbi:hypothetical protein GXW83_13630 [Streptacidiphilus sp. PB12-B1b]|uniref:DUF6271 family protein n=1 Tax=Streptacidiphilus sp. PB12-B1b TaxID=2705012 RepID=UPI0015F8D6FF|nr:DUF6271 family protein [Streptacidiphilus sp. PB12-B1b]QMU80248.1 hypothetical protein GXW83_13630 [Streptacidiphilus sp. PB12-B1b]